MDVGRTHAAILRDMPSLPQQELEDLGRRLGERHGYQFRPAAYFASSGILVHTPAVADREIAVIERSVFLYPRHDRWQARVTQHGGPHWIREVDTITRLEEVALEALQSGVCPPTTAWKVE